MDIIEGVKGENNKKCQLKKEEGREKKYKNKRSRNENLWLDINYNLCVYVFSFLLF